MGKHTLQFRNWVNKVIKLVWKNRIFSYTIVEMSVYLYKNFDIYKIRFNDTIKKKVIESPNPSTVHSIDMCCNNIPIFIQLDKSVCIVDDNNCLILEVTNGVENFIKGLEEHIIETVYNKAERWFNGRRFTMAKIQNGLVSCLSQGKLTVTLSDKSCFFNQFRKKLSLEEISKFQFPLESTCVVRLCCLQFIGNKFTYKISVEQCKMNIEYKLVEYSIIESVGKSQDSITPITGTESDKSYREYPEYYHSEVDSAREDFFK